MKKIFVMLLAAMMLFTACGGSGETTKAGSEAATTGAASGKEFVFTVKGVEIAMNAEAAPLVEKLGGSPAYFESESCAFKGLDKQYDYGSYVIYTYPKDEVDYILSVELKDDTVETAEGICIGSSKDDVVKALGEPDDQTPKACIYKGGASELTVMIENDAVTSIQYQAVTK